MASLGEAVVETSLDLTGINKGVKDGLGKAFKDAATPASKAAEAATSKAINGVTKRVQSGLSGVTSTVTRVFTNAFGGVQNLLAPLTARLSGIGSTVRSAFSTVGATVTRALGPVATLAGRAFGTISGAARSAVSGLRNVFGPVGATIGRAFSTVSSVAGKALAPLGRMMGPIKDRLISDAKQAAAMVGKALKTGLQVVGVAVGTAAGAAIGTALSKGLSRLTAIDNAQAKLKGLGNDAKSVEQIMANALESVEGTAFGLGEAATTAAGAVAAGIKPGEDLTRVLTSTANTAAAAGVSMEEMGSIFNRVAANGKASNAELQQLADRGVPIYQALADQLGVTAQEVFDMASAGKIGFAEFESAAASAAGNVADEMGKTVSGSLANLQASLGRMGAGLFEGVFSNMAPVLQTVTKAMKPLEGVAKTLGAALGDTLVPLMEKGAAAVLGFSLAFTDAKSAKEILDGLPKPIQKLSGVIEKFTGFGERLKSFWDSLSGNAQIATVIGAVAGAFTLFGSAIQPILGALGPIGGLIGQLVPNIGALGGVLRLALGPFGLIVGVLTAAFASSEEFRGAVMGLVGSLMPLAQTLIGAVGPILSMLPGLFKMVVAAVTPLLTVIVQLASDLVGMLVPVIQSLIGSILPPLMSLFRSLLPVILSLVPVIAQLVQTLAGLLIPVIRSLLPVVQTVFRAVGAIIGAVVPIIDGIVKTISAIIQGDWSAAWEGIKTTVLASFKFLDTLAGAALAIGRDLIRGLINGARSLLSNVGQLIKKLGRDIINWFKSVLGISSPSRIFQGFGRDILQGLINGVKGMASAVGSAVRSVGSTMINLFRNAVQSVRSVLSGLRGIASSALSSMASAVSGGIQRVVGFFRNLGGQVRGAISGLASSLHSVGTQMMQGMINGLAGMAGAVAAKARSVVQGAVDGAKRLLKIASPSKVFRDIGLYIDQGLVKGMTGGEKQVKSTADSLTKKVINAFDKITKDSKFNPGKDAEVAARRLIRSEAATLRALASQREKLSGRMKKATKKLEDAVKVRNDAIRSVRSAVTAMADVTKIEGQQDKALTGSDVITSLRGTLKDAQEYNQILKVLRKRGLGDTVYGQLVEAGPEGGLEAARAIKSGGTAMVKQVNNLQKRIRTQANILARTSAHDMYGAGVKAAAGLVKGLRSQDKKLTAQARRMAKAMAREVKKELKIASPSRVFRDIGVFTGQGLIVGMDGVIQQVTAAGDRMAAAAVPGASGSVGRVTASNAPTAAPRRVFVDEAGRGGASVQIDQNYYGPTTSGGRLKEMDWTMRYATRARGHRAAGMAE